MVASKNIFKIVVMIVFFIVTLPTMAPACASTVSMQAVSSDPSIGLVNSTANPALDAAVLVSANQYGVPFDHDVEISRIITTDDGRYYVVKYENYLPLAGGIEILAENGTKVTSSSQATSILRAVAWTESIRSLDDTDIATLEVIRDNSQNIRYTVTPLTNLSNSLIDTFNLKRSLNQYGITNDFAVGLITGSVNSTNAGYEGAVILINNLNNQLNDFSNATVEVNERLPGIITRSTEIKNGTSYADRKLQDDIVSTTADLDVMQGKIETVQGALDKMSGVGEFLASIQQLATGLLAYVPIIGNSLSGFANYLLSTTGDYLANVFNLETYAKNLLDNIQQEKLKLNSVIAEANQKTAELTGSWNARQTAWAKVWIYVIGLALLLIAIPAALLIAFLYRRNIASAFKSIQERGKK